MTTCNGNNYSPGCRWYCLWWRLFVLSFFPRDVLDENWDLIESVSEGFTTCSFKSDYPKMKVVWHSHREFLKWQGVLNFSLEMILKFPTYSWLTIKHFCKNIMNWRNWKFWWFFSLWIPDHFNFQGGVIWSTDVLNQNGAQFWNQRHREVL